MEAFPFLLVSYGNSIDIMCIVKVDKNIELANPARPLNGVPNAILVT